jgi:hypothetical protein
VLESIERLAYGSHDPKKLLPLLNKDSFKELLQIITETTFTPPTPSITCTKKKKAINETIIENYLVKIKKEKGLTMKEIKRLFLQLNLKLTLKMLPLKNIVIQNGEIVDITDPVFPNHHQHML